jgi:cold shock CspA family protein
MPQGTVKSFDPATRSVVVLDDALAEYPVSAETFAASGLRELRLGQRVRFELESSGDRDEVTNLQVITL